MILSVVSLSAPPAALLTVTIVAEDGTTTEIEIPVGTGYFGGDVDDGGSSDGGGGSDGGS